MTKVGQLFEDEKIRTVKEATAKVTEEVTKKVTEQITLKAAEKAFRQGLSAEAIAEILSLTKEEVLEIQDRICTLV